MPDDLQEWHDHLFELLAQAFTLRHETGVTLAEIRERITNIRLLAAQLRCEECIRVVRRPM